MLRSKGFTWLNKQQKCLEVPTYPWFIIHHEGRYLLSHWAVYPLKHVWDVLTVQHCNTRALRANKRIGWRQASVTAVIRNSQKEVKLSQTGGSCRPVKSQKEAQQPATLIVITCWRRAVVIWCAVTQRAPPPQCHPNKDEIEFDCRSNCASFR